MLDWLPSIPYPPSQGGYWSPATATLNCCEEDYYATVYAAEIVNTLTSLMSLYLASKGIRSCILNKHNTVFLISFQGYLTVSVGSILFHLTLKYPMQLVDVLSMIYTTCILFHASFSHGQTARIAVLLASALVSFAVSITADYLQDTVFHENTYGILTTIMLLRSVWIMEGYIRQMRREKECMAPSADDHDDRHDHDHNGAATANGSAEWYKTLERVRRDVRMLRTMFTTSLSIFLGGFAVRSLDNRYCSTLHRWREEIGLPWGIFLECHGWWHLMTGVGAYFYIVWGIWLRHCLEGRADDVELVWPSVWSVPDVIRRPAEAKPAKVEITEA